MKHSSNTKDAASFDHMTCSSQFAGGIVEGSMGGFALRLAGSQLLAQLLLCMAAGLEVQLEAGQLLAKLLGLAGPADCVQLQLPQLPPQVLCLPCAVACLQSHQLPLKLLQLSLRLHNKETQSAWMVNCYCMRSCSQETEPLWPAAPQERILDQFGPLHLRKCCTVLMHWYTGLSMSLQSDHAVSYSSARVHCLRWAHQH